MKDDLTRWLKAEMDAEEAAKIALRTQQVIMEETGVANVADPLGGSWYVEALTDEIERRAAECLARIDAAGGRSGSLGGLGGQADTQFEPFEEGAPFGVHGRGVLGPLFVIRGYEVRIPAGSDAKMFHAFLCGSVHAASRTVARHCAKWSGF